MLLALAVVPGIAGLYLFLHNKRQAQAAAFRRLAGRMEGRTAGRLRRHLPALLFFLSLGTILVALARPQAEVMLPRVEGTVILVFDVSGSMAATDAEPTRMEAAKAAAREFVLSQPETIRIGIVSFSSSGFAVQPPTNDPNVLLAAIDRMEPQNGTSLGQGILVALNTIAVDAGLASPQQETPEAPSGSPSEEQPETQPGSSEDFLLDALPEGPFPPAVIVLLSDGEHNMSVNPFAAAEAASEREVRIDALGFGSVAGTTLELEGFSVYTALNEAVLEQIARITGGAYYHPDSEPDPQGIYANLTPELVVKREQMEVTSIFAGAGLLLLLAAGLFSMIWQARFP